MSLTTSLSPPGGSTATFATDKNRFRLRQPHGLLFSRQQFKQLMKPLRALAGCDKSLPICYGQFNGRKRA